MKNAIRNFKCIGCSELVSKSCGKKVKFCSPSCYQKNKGALNLLPNKKQTVKCLTCKDEFKKPPSLIRKKNFCSVKCFNVFQSKKIEITCIVCNKQKVLSPSFINQKYCSIKCRDKCPKVNAHLIEINKKQQSVKVNKFEAVCYELLDNDKIKYEPQKTMFNKFCVDAFIKETKTIIQFDGDYWHGNKNKFPNPDKRQKKRMALDISQDSYFKKAGYNVFRIWQSEVDKDKSCLVKRLKQHQQQLKMF
jgi:very-short-patch-repair endonuclease